MVRENKLESCYLRPLTWIGSEKLGVSPKGNTIHLMVAAWPWGAYLGEEGMKRGIRVKTSQLHAPPRQHHHDAGQGGEQLHQLDPGQHGSHRRRLRRGDAARRRRASSAKARARTCSSSRTAWSTRPTCRPARSTASPATPCSRICKDLGLEAGAKSASRATRSTSADEAFFTGTAAEVTPIRELDRIELGSGSRGPITEKIQSAFFDIVNGRNPKYADWLTQGLKRSQP